MDDIQLILYIIFVAIAILTRVFKSKKKDQPQPQQQSSPGEYENTTQDEPKSFEDLLKEFTGESTAVEKEVSSYEEEQYEADDEIETYESANYDTKELKTIDELVDLEDDRHTGNFKHFAGYEEQEENVNNEFVEALQDEEGARKAIIFSEIINRKY